MVSDLHLTLSGHEWLGARRLPLSLFHILEHPTCETGMLVSENIIVITFPSVFQMRTCHPCSGLFGPALLILINGYSIFPIPEAQPHSFSLTPLFSPHMILWLSCSSSFTTWSFCLDYFCQLISLIAPALLPIYYLEALSKSCPQLLFKDPPKLPTSCDPLFLCTCLISHSFQPHWPLLCLGPCLWLSSLLSHFPGIFFPTHLQDWLPDSMPGSV